jgi:hypothetical protein
MRGNVRKGLQVCNRQNKADFGGMREARKEQGTGFLQMPHYSVVMMRLTRQD